MFFLFEQHHVFFPKDHIFCSVYRCFLVKDASKAHEVAKRVPLESPNSAREAAAMNVAVRAAIKQDLNFAKALQDTGSKFLLSKSENPSPRWDCSDTPDDLNFNLYGALLMHLRDGGDRSQLSDHHQLGGNVLSHYFHPDECTVTEKSWTDFLRNYLEMAKADRK